MGKTVPINCDNDTNPTDLLTYMCVYIYIYIYIHTTHITINVKTIVRPE